MDIVLLDGYTLNPGDLSWEGFEKIGRLTVHDRTLPGDVLERSKHAEVLLTNKTPLHEDVLKQLTGLKYVGVLATGYNVVDTEAASKLDIVVTNVPGYATASVAQMTFALLLELCLHVQRHSDSVKQEKWAESSDFCYWEYPLIELNGKTIGIIGYGAIGRKVGEIASAFGMKVLANDRNMSSGSSAKDFKWTAVSQLLSHSDVVSMHCPLTPETQGLINKENLQRMKTSALLINTSRGPLILEEDLAEALNQGVIAGAGLDVLSIEPPRKDNPLYMAKNCLITPHISWATREARTRLMDLAVSNLKAFMNGNETNRVN